MNASGILCNPQMPALVTLIYSLKLTKEMKSDRAAENQEANLLASC